MDENLTASTHSVPGLDLPVCPWCKRHGTSYFLLVYVRNGVTELEVMCASCEAAAIQFAEMHVKGISRCSILADFGFRGPDAPWPEQPEAT